MSSNESPNRLHVTFVDKDGDHHEFEVSKGDNLLDIAQANDLEMEGMLRLRTFSIAQTARMHELEADTFLFLSLQVLVVALAPARPAM